MATAPNAGGAVIATCAIRPPTGEDWLDLLALAVGAGSPAKLMSAVWWGVLGGGPRRRLPDTPAGRFAAACWLINAGRPTGWDYIAALAAPAQRYGPAMTAIALRAARQAEANTTDLLMQIAVVECERDSATADAQRLTEENAQLRRKLAAAKQMAVNVARKMQGS